MAIIAHITRATQRAVRSMAGGLRWVDVLDMIVLSVYCLIPQIAGSYRGSYFPKIGLLIPKIAAAAT